MVGHGGSSAGSYLADPTSPISSHCASIVTTSTVRVKSASPSPSSHAVLIHVIPFGSPPIHLAPAQCCKIYLLCWWDNSWGDAYILSPCPGNNNMIIHSIWEKHNNRSSASVPSQSTNPLPIPQVTNPSSHPRQPAPFPHPRQPTSFPHPRQPTPCSHTRQKPLPHTTPFPTS